MNPCPMCRNGRDEIVHLLRCKAVNTFVCKVIDSNHSHESTFALLTLSPNWDKHHRLMGMLCAFAIYEWCNFVRHNNVEGANSPDRLFDHARHAAMASDQLRPIWLSFRKRKIVDG